jgi:hypothetical protein
LSGAKIACPARESKPKSQPAGEFVAAVGSGGGVNGFDFRR